MSDYLAGFYPDFVEQEEPRQIILDLGKMITNRIPVKLGFQKLNKYDPEYWGLAMLLTDEQAEVALKMGVRKPKTMEDMVKLTGKTEAELEKLLGDMSFMGILEYNWENPTRTKQWVLPMFVPGSAEFTNMNDTILKKYPEMGRFFERMSRLPLEKVTPMVPPGGAGIGMHVIPVEKAIETENQSISVEHISHWLDKYEGKYAASPCSCRKSRLTFDEGCAAVRPVLVNPVPQGVISILSVGINALALALIIKRSKEQKKNPYKQEIFTDTKDFQLAMARAED